MNKRILSLLAVVAVLMAMFAFTTTASAYYRVYSACPNGKPLNIREGRHWFLFLWGGNLRHR